MYMPPAPSLAPVHSFGSVPESGPHRFGMPAASSMAPKSFTGGAIPSSSQPSDMGNSITHKQSARVVVTPVTFGKSELGEEYEKQLKTLAEREFCMIVDKTGQQGDLHPTALPGDHAKAISLAYLNHQTLEHESSNTEDKLAHAHVSKESYFPLGPVIQTDLSTRHSEKLQRGPMGHVNRGVTNIAVGGRAAFANCFIRTGEKGMPVNIGDAVSVATFVFRFCNTTGAAAGHKYDFKTFSFLFVDNDYDLLNISKHEREQAQSTMKISDGVSHNLQIKTIVGQCKSNMTDANKLCMALRCAFRSPGKAYCVAEDDTDPDEISVDCICTAIQCVGVVIECPIPNAVNESELTVINNMFSEHTGMSSTHPVYVQMSS